MALTKTLQNPYGASGEMIEGYIWIADAEFNFASNYGRITFHVHTSEAASTSGRPIKAIVMELRPNGRPEVKDKDGNVIAAAIPPFQQLMYQNRDMITELAEAMFGLALTSQPEIVGATSIPLQPIVEPE